MWPHIGSNFLNFTAKSHFTQLSGHNLWQTGHDCKLSFFTRSTIMTFNGKISQMSWYLVTPGHKHVQLVTSGNMWSHLATAYSLLITFLFTNIQFVSHHIRIWHIILQLCNKASYVWFRRPSWYEGIPSGTFIPSYHEKWRRQIEMLRNAVSPQSSVQC